MAAQSSPRQSVAATDSGTGCPSRAARRLSGGCGHAGLDGWHGGSRAEMDAQPCHAGGTGVTDGSTSAVKCDDQKQRDTSLVSGVVLHRWATALADEEQPTDFSRIPKRGELCSKEWG